MPLDALRGALVQGVIQIFYGRIEITERMLEAAKDWGFEKELNAFMGYRAQMIHQGLPKDSSLQRSF